MALGNCVELLHARIGNAEAVTRLTDAGALTAPPDALLRACRPPPACRPTSVAGSRASTSAPASGTSPPTPTC
eukprot:4480863-Lingulodinium_polyedra.AAC.1